MRAADFDPTGEHHGGLPTYGWRQAPPGLATRRQLTDMGLRPGGQDIAAQMIFHRGERVAYLYRVDLALPKRVPTLRQEEALDRAMAARQTCPLCGIRWPICLPLKTLGSCLGCYEQQAAAADPHSPETPLAA